MSLSNVALSLSWGMIIIAALSAFLIGGVWYGPLFGRAWKVASGLSEEDLSARNMPRVFGLSLTLVLIAAINLEMFLGPQASALFGLGAGFLAGAGWVATLLGVIYAFECRSSTLWAIDAGYAVVALSAMGALLGAA